MIKIIKKCNSLSLGKYLNVEDEVEFDNEDSLVEGGYAIKVEKQTKQKKQTHKKK